MIHTNLEAMVEPEKWELLQQAYGAFDKKDLPITLLSSHLVQDQSEPKLWRIVSFWQNRKALDEYRASVKVPAWVAVFRAAGVEPKFSVSEVMSSKG